MHIHLSLFRGDDNAFYDDDDDYNLSPIAKSFMAGLLRHAAEITAITNQTVNSYKRLVPGFEAPVHVSWARNNRSGLIRVPIAKRGNPIATRIEYRSPDPACNPYLAFSRDARRRHARRRRGLRAAGRGRRQPVRDRATTCSPSSGIDQLPQSLSDALRVMEQSELVHEALGEHIFEWFLRNKRSEWRAYKTHVSALRDRPLPEGAVDVAVTRTSCSPSIGEPAPPELARTLDLGGYRWKAVAVGRGGRRARAAGRLGRGDRRLRRPTPTGRGRSPARCASATPGDPPLLAARHRRPARRPRAARRAVRRLLPDPVPPGRARGPASATCCGAVGGGSRSRTWSSTASWRSTSRRTRRRSPAARSTSRTWSTSC